MRIGIAKKLTILYTFSSTNVAKPCKNFQLFQNGGLQVCNIAKLVTAWNVANGAHHIEISVLHERSTSHNISLPNTHHGSGEVPN
jgi:hypothetical protein